MEQVHPIGTRGVISIGCPIYRSAAYCDHVYNSLYKYTPHLSDGRAEFYFVANDATREVKAHLNSRGYPHYLQENSGFTDEELTARGLAEPEYITRCYRAFNRIYSEARGGICVQISSDFAFSPGWLDALLERNDGASIVSSQLIEPEDKANREAGAIIGDFGRHPRQFDEAGFLAKAEEVRRAGTRPGGQYGPWLIPMVLFHENGGYPEGNLANGRKYGIPGDVALVRRYALLGTRHITACDSVVYHFCEGEMRE